MGQEQTYWQRNDDIVFEMVGAETTPHPTPTPYHYHPHPHTHCLKLFRIMLEM